MPTPRNRSAVLVGQPFRRLGRAQALEHHPDLGDLDGLGPRDGPHPGAPVLHPLDEALAGQLQERGAHVAPAGPEPLGQVGLDETLVGGELAVHDGVTDAVDDDRDRRTRGEPSRRRPTLLRSFPTTPTTASLTIESKPPYRRPSLCTVGQLASGRSSDACGVPVWRVRGPKTASVTAPTSQAPAMKKNTLW